MKSYNKNYFNMVEIVLALAVVAIAIVSLMGMLPVALRASKNSVADNSVASVVEIMKSFIDAEYKKASDFNSFQEKFQDDKPDDDESVILEYSDGNTKFPSDSNVLKNYAFQITNGNTAGTYRVDLFSGKFEDDKFAVTDFSADVRVWYKKLDGEIYIPTDTDNLENNIYKSGTREVPLTHACTFYVEVSWPSGVKYANQEHRLYKFDYFAR